MDTATLHRRGELLKGCAAMGGFAVTAQQAEQAVLAYEKKKAEGRCLSFQDTVARVQQRRQASALR